MAIVSLHDGTGRHTVMASASDRSDQEREGRGGSFPVYLPRHNGSETAARDGGNQRYCQLQ